MSEADELVEEHLTDEEVSLRLTVQIALWRAMERLGYKPTPEAVKELRRVAITAARAAVLEEAWQPIETAPKDGTRVWAILRDTDDRWPNRSFEIWHEGLTEGGFDLGWTLFPGYGGVADRHFAGWRPLPDPPRALRGE